MQDIHTLGGVGDGGGGGTAFTATGVGGVERRPRPHTHQNHHQPLKCPRCDSLNTKFCYFNNYNLSQPRHFCKGCRRYWTKGGVLRNVPFGGGCRKSKRSSKPKATAGAATSSSSAADNTKNEQNSNSLSSSESSSLTATTTAGNKANTAAGAGTTPEVASASETPSSSNSSVLNFADSRFFLTPNVANTSFDHNQPLIDQHHESSDAQIFSFTNMMTSSNEPGLLGFYEHAPVEENHNPGPNLQHHQNEHKKIMRPSSNEMVSNNRYLDQRQGDVVQVDLTALEQQNRESNSGLAVLEWGNGGSGNDNSGEGGLFDFTGAIDQYWSQAQWVNDSDHQSLNFLQ